MSIDLVNSSPNAEIVFKAVQKIATLPSNIQSEYGWEKNNTDLFKLFPLLDAIPQNPNASKTCDSSYPWQFVCAERLYTHVLDNGVHQDWLNTITSFLAKSVRLAVYRRLLEVPGNNRSLDKLPSPLYWQAKKTENADTLLHIPHDEEKGTFLFEHRAELSRLGLVDLEAYWKLARYDGISVEPTPLWFWYSTWIMASDEQRMDITEFLVRKGKIRLLIDPYYKDTLQKTLQSRLLPDLLGQKLFTEPDLAQVLFEKAFIAERLVIQSYESTYHKFDTLLRLVCNLVPTTHLDKAPTSELTTLLQNPQPVPVKKITTLPAEMQAASVEFLGRTAVCNKSMAYKIGPRKGEEREKALQEASCFLKLKKHAECIGFQSKIPTVKCVMQIDKLPEWVIKNIEATGVSLESSGPYYILQYEADPTYFQYLNDPGLSEEAFLDGLSRFCHDAALEIHHGVFPVTAELYHNVAANRPYMPLIRLFCSLPSGAGRFHGLDSSVDNSNGRAAGLADWSDFELDESLRANPRKFFSDFPVKHDAKEFPWMLHSEMISRTCLVATILCILRLEKMYKALDHESSEQIDTLANYLQVASSAILKGYTRQSGIEDYSHFVGKLFNNKMRAKQLIFWTQNYGSNGYVAWLESGKLPPGLYPPEMEVIFKGVKAISNWTKAGLSTDQKQRDWGVYSGSFLLTEEEAAWYKLSLLCQLGAAT